MKSISLFVAALLISYISSAQVENSSLKIPTEATKPEAKNTDAAPVAQTTKVSGVDYESGRSSFGITFFSIGGIDRSQLTDGKGQQSMYFFEDYLALSYRFSSDFRLSVRHSFNYSTAGTDKFGKEATDKVDTRDMSLLMTFSNLLQDTLPAKVTLKSQPRLYLPTSENSKAQGEIASLRLENEMKIYVGRYNSFRLWISPQYYFQRATTFTDDKGYVKTTDMFAYKHGVEFTYDLSKIFSLKPGYEAEDTWTNSSGANNLTEYRKTNIDYRLGLGINVAKPLSFTVGYSHKKDLIKTGEYADGFTLMTVATLY